MTDRRPCWCGKIGCHLCRLAASDAVYRVLWGIDSRPPPCAFEGPVMEWTPCRSEEKAIRHCLHPLAGHGRCTRGLNSGADPDVASCATCKLNPANGATNEPTSGVG